MYQIILHNFFVFDKIGPNRAKNLRNHIEADDYFGTLATILNLIKQTDFTDKNFADKNKKELEKLKEDLIYLQENYKIVGKNNY